MSFLRDLLCPEQNVQAQEGVVFQTQKGSTLSESVDFRESWVRMNSLQSVQSTFTTKVATAHLPSGSQLGSYFSSDSAGTAPLSLTFGGAGAGSQLTYSDHLRPS